MSHTLSSHRLSRRARRWPARSWKRTLALQALVLAAVGVLGLLAAAPAAAHDFRVTRTTLAVVADGSFEVEMVCDLDALALGASPDAEDRLLRDRLAAMAPAEREERLARLRSILERRVRVRFDGEPVLFEVRLPGPQPGREEDADTFLGTRVMLRGRVPTGASTVTFFASRSFPPVLLAARGADGRLGEPLPLEPGAISPELDLDDLARRPARLVVFGLYLRLGFLHILPAGPDHILFVLGLFLLGTSLRPLLLQVTCFTLAHTLTLALATYGVARLPAGPVEVLIALSIVYVAVENLLTERLLPWRLAVVFAFGLLHGLGFAGVLAEVGLPSGRLPTALLAFNVGVELGQLAVLGLALALFGWWRSRPGYRRWVTVPGSIAIAAVGLWWVIERL